MPPPRQAAVLSSWKQQGATIVGDAAGDGLGRSLAISADASILAIGAPFSSDDTGYVKVFHTNDGGNVVQLGQTIFGDNHYDNFGYFVDITPDGMTIICGSSEWTGEIDGPGYVRVFTLEGDSSLGTDDWMQIGQDIVGDANGANLGDSVSISGDGKTIAVGAPRNDGTNGVISGLIRMYRLVNNDGVSWEQIGQDINGDAAGDQSGASVSLSADGSTIAIGAVWNDNNGDLAGQVRVYQFDGERSSWEQLGQSMYGDNAHDLFGCSVQLSQDGTTLAIGSPGFGVDGNSDWPGYVRVFSLEGVGSLSMDNWNQIGQDIVGDAIGGRFGFSISLSDDGKTLGVGAPDAEGKNGRLSGRVSAYQIDESDSIWIKIGDGIDGEGVLDRSGWSVSLSADGKKVAIGSYSNSDNGYMSGHVRVYVLE
jgi:hypothetical protein